MRFYSLIKKAGVLFGCALFAQGAVAQQDFLLYGGFDNLPQASHVNPAFRPSSKAYLAMPAMNTYIGAAHTGFQLNHLLQTRAQDDSLILNPSLAIEKMADVNYVPLNLSNELIGFGFTVGESYFNFTLTNKTNFRFSYPKDLFRFAVEGNGGDLLGERASLDGLAIDFMSYAEAGIGFNRKFGDKLTLGGKLKYLVGWANVHTANSQLGIHTDETTFDITVDGQMTVNTSNLIPTNDSISFDIQDILSAQNMGMGIDLGGVFEITDKISVSASVMDLGVITWKNNVNNFKSDSVNFTFQGVDINEFISDSTAVFETMVDSLEGIFTYSENTEKYTTLLPTRIYLGGTFKLTEKIQAGVNWYSEFYHSRYRGALTASGSMQVTNWFRFAMNYTYYSRDYKNLGLGFAINGGPFQFYLMSDNVIGFMAPQATKNWHVRTGINFLIGRQKKEDTSVGSME